MFAAAAVVAEPSVIIARKVLLSRGHCERYATSGNRPRAHAAERHRIRYYGPLASGKRTENVARAPANCSMPPIIPVDAIMAISPAAVPAVVRHDVMTDASLMVPFVIQITVRRATALDCDLDHNAPSSRRRSLRFATSAADSSGGEPEIGGLHAQKRKFCSRRHDDGSGHARLGQVQHSRKQCRHPADGRNVSLPHDRLLSTVSDFGARLLTGDPRHSVVIS